MIESQVIKNFAIEGEFVSAEPYGSGHINSTRLVIMKTDKGEEKYILQRINNNVFKNPAELMENYVGVTSYLRDIIEGAGGDPMRETLNVIKTKSGENFYYSEEDGYWRLLVFVDDSLSYDKVVSEINKNVLVDVGIVGDVRDAFMRIVAGVQAQDHPEWREQVAKLSAREAQFESEQRERAGEKLVPRRVLDIINANKLPKTVFTTDVGQHQMWTAQYAKFDGARRFVSSGGLGTMGFGMGAAIGAQVATKDPVVLVTGDGSFGMNLNELATAVSYKIPLVIVLMNNGVLGMVRQWQTLFFNGHYSNTTLERKTNFVKLAEAFGAVGMTATTPAEFEECFKKALTVTDGPVVIDTYVDKDEFVLPMLPPGGSIEDLITNVRKKGEKM